VPALPAVSFPVYGLSSGFVGSRGLGLWDRRQATSQEKDIVLPVFRVQLLHSVETVQSGQPGRPAMVVKVSTICKRLADWNIQRLFRLRLQPPCSGYLSWQAFSILGGSASVPE